MSKHANKGRITKTKTPAKTYQLGDLVSVAFEQARAITKDDHQAAQLASLVVERLLLRQNRPTQLATV